jgi:hypothetical protein
MSPLRSSLSCSFSGNTFEGKIFHICGTDGVGNHDEADLLPFAQVVTMSILVSHLLCVSQGHKRPCLHLSRSLGVALWPAKAGGGV